MIFIHNSMSFFLLSLVVVVVILKEKVIKDEEFCEFSFHKIELKETHVSN